MKARLKAIVEFLRAHPVVMFDVTKYAVAIALLFGVNLPSGVDVIAAGAALTVLSLITQKVVAKRVDDALNTPVPEPAKDGSL